jgi:hypothetical protein
MKLAVATVTIVALAGCAEQTPETRTRSTTAASERETPTPESGVTPEQNDAIDALFRRKAPELQACWTEEYEKTHDRKLEGDVTLGLTVARNGQPRDVKVLTSTLKNTDIEGCVQKTIAQWSFPEVPEPVPYMRTVHLGAEF